MKDVQRLRELAQDVRVLYVEDNEGLREKTGQLLRKFFNELHIAEDGLKGLEAYKKYQPDIVITDLRMPGLDGFAMCEKILALNPSVKFIITTAHDEKEYLLQAIQFGVFRFLKKPLVVEHLVEALLACLEKSISVEHVHTFESEITKIFNYQNNLLLLVKKGVPVFANPKFYEFFGAQDMEEFLHRCPNFGDLFLEHKGFLSTRLSITWYDQIINGNGHLFHVKFQDLQGKYRHFILNAHKVPDVEDEYILSFDDVTELNMMDLFVAKGKKTDAIEQELKDIPPKYLTTLLDMVHNNQSKISLLNFYRGLTITNDAQIVEYDEQKIVLKSAFFQLKVIWMEGFTTIRSDFFPKDIHGILSDVNFDKQTVTLRELKFISESASARKYVRVEPDNAHARMHHNGKDYDVKVVDLSTKSMKIRFPMLPPSFEKETHVTLHVEIPTKEEVLHFTCQASVFKIDKQQKFYDVVLMTQVSKEDEKMLLGYIPKRQMELIREFKSVEERR